MSSSQQPPVRSPGLIVTAPPVLSTALILCGGLGTRLRPLTQSTPKPLVELANVPLVEHILEQLARQGVNRIVLAVGNCTEHYIQHIPFWRRVFTREIYTIADSDDFGTPLGTGGAVLNVAEALPHFFSEPFYVLNGDILVHLPLEGLASSLRTTSTLASIAAIHVEDVSSFGALKISNDGHITHFGEKSETGEGYANAGIYALSPDALKYFKKPSSIEKDVFPMIVAEGAVMSTRIPDNSSWFDLGTVESYLQVSQWVLDGGYTSKCISRRVEKMIKDTMTMTLDSVLKPPVIISKSAYIGNGSVVGPNSIIGDGCVIGEGCLIKDSIVLPRAEIGKHCVLNNSVLSPDCKVEDDLTIENESK